MKIIADGWTDRDSDPNCVVEWRVEGGMSLREHYAGLAMKILIDSWPFAEDDVCKEKAARKAVMYADALIAELEKNGV